MLNETLFRSLGNARQLIEAWRHDYNHHRPHSKLGWLTPADYAALFDRLAARGLPMICANPDLVVERGDTLVYCAGSLAAAYAAKGGKVTYAGKPYLPIYERTFAEIARLAGGPLPKARILAIGDGLDTDLAGAHGAGLDSVFIASAVHLPGELNAQTLGLIDANEFLELTIRIRLDPRPFRLHQRTIHLPLGPHLRVPSASRG